MNKIDDGGPAFPHVNPNYDGNWDKEPQRAGMSIRDFFAIHIAGGMAAFSGTAGVPYGLVDIARRSYEVADFMLKEREK